MMVVVNKRDLIRYAASAAKKSGHPVNQGDAEAIINAFLDGIGKCVRMNEKVTLSGFGRFEARSKGRVDIRNPRTGEVMDVPERKTIGFKSSPKLKEKVNGETRAG